MDDPQSQPLRSYYNKKSGSCKKAAAKKRPSEFAPPPSKRYKTQYSATNIEAAVVGHCPMPYPYALMPYAPPPPKAPNCPIFNLVCLKHILLDKSMPGAMHPKPLHRPFVWVKTHLPRPDTCLHRSCTDTVGLE
jgi:hypothetical protein